MSIRTVLPCDRTRNGLTILELLVVLAIIGVLLGLIVPAVVYARAASRRVACANHLRQLALATHSYHDSHGVFPPWASYVAEDYRIGGAIHRLLSRELHYGSSISVEVFFNFQRS